jgi:predicted dinucleotide-binding enzyme
VSAETITLIGTGNVGAALGERFAGLGHRIVSGSRTPEAGVNFQLRPEPS